MTVQIIRGPLVEAPTPARRIGGLLDVAEVREGMAWMDGNDMFTSWNCNDMKTTDVCATDQTPAKTFIGPVVVDGTRFALYLGGQCKPLTEEVESNIDRVFDLRESRGIERAFEVAVLGTGSDVGAATSAAAALGMMENALADQYAGVGTIHMSPLVATLLLQDALLTKDGNRFYTQLGTNVVVGSGYTSDVMYGSGDVVIYRGPKVLVDSPDMANNTVNVLAERAYVVVDDCIKLKITGIPVEAA